MGAPESCELHDIGLFLGSSDSDALLELARSPIGDECRICPVCRLAREYVQVRLGEMSGQRYSTEGNSEALRRELESAVRSVKANHHASA